MPMHHKNNYSWLMALLIAEVLLFGFFYNVHAVGASRLVADKDLIFIPEIPIAGITKIVINGSTIGNYINTFYLWAIRAVTVLAVFMVMLAGIRWITANGNASTITIAKTQMTDAIIGLVLILCTNLILHSINPQLTVFKSLDITPIARVDLIPAVNLSAILSPMGWYAPPNYSYGGKTLPGEPSPGARGCGALTKDEFDEKGRSFYGVECAGLNDVCILKFELEVDKEEYDKMLKGEIDLDDLRGEVKKIKSSCAPLPEDITVKRPAPGGDSLREYAPYTGGVCGQIFPPYKLNPRTSERVGEMCWKLEEWGMPKFKYSTKFCLFATLTLKSPSGESYHFYEEPGGSCFLNGQLRFCPKDEMRRNCAMCGGSGNCTDSIFWSEEERDKRICCAQIRGQQETYNLRDTIYIPN